MRCSQFPVGQICLFRHHKFHWVVQRWSCISALHRQRSLRIFGSRLRCSFVRRNPKSYRQRSESDCQSMSSIEASRMLTLFEMYPVFMGFITGMSLSSNVERQLMVCLAFPFAISLSFVITDFESVITTPTGLPLIEVYYQATGSKAGTSVLMTAFAICFFGCATANITSSSRQMWAASRDNCFPLSKYWKQVHPRWQMPVNAACLSGTLVSVGTQFSIANLFF